MEGKNQSSQEQVLEPEKKTVFSKNRKNFIILAVSGVIIVLFLAVIVFVVTSLQKEKETESLPQTLQTSSVAPRTEYENPFEENSQYVNPFFSYKNPFDNLK